MSLPVVLRAEAEVEFDAAFDWYDGQRVGFGQVFAEAVQHVFDLVAGHPRMYRRVRADIRKATVKRFPYCIFYRAHDDHVEVIAVFHSRRDPSIWIKRI